MKSKLIEDYITVCLEFFCLSKVYDSV